MFIKLPPCLPLNNNICNDAFSLSMLTTLKNVYFNVQVSTLRLDEYINLVGQFKEAIKNLKIASPNVASAYFLQEYTEQLTKPLLVDPAQRTSRQRPTVGLDAVDSRVSAMELRKHIHQAFVVELLRQSNIYWFEHDYWQRQPNNVLRLENMGHLLNMISDTLQLRLDDPVRPSHKRCTKCNKLFSLTDNAPHSDCNNAERVAIPSLVGNFKRVSVVVPSALANMVDTPEHVNGDSLSHLKSVVLATRSGPFKTLEGWIKNLVCRNAASVQPGVLELLLVRVSVACSEAIAETYGSVMEVYHQTRFLNNGPRNDDIRLQQEMFLRLNGPPLGNCEHFCRIIASRLKIGPTAAYQQMQPSSRQVKTSKTLKRLKKESSGFFKF